MPVGVSQAFTSLPALRMRPASSPPSTRRGSWKLEQRCSASRVAGVLSPGETGLSGRTHTAETSTFSRQTAPRFLRAATPPTWNWRNLFRTPSARSGATAPCRKRRGQQTKVSVMHQNVVCFTACCSDTKLWAFSMWKHRAARAEMVNKWLTKVWDGAYQ